MFAPAKINLYLHVTGRRADGYHELDSLIAFAGVGDDVTCEAIDDLALVTEGPFAGSLGPAEDNLAMRAARALAAAAGIVPRARLRLTKRLPVAAGIGGGSADAAAALRALCALWRLDFEAAGLARIGMAVGADVPVCLWGRPALVSGAGERIAPAPALPAAWLVLVNPGEALATEAVFAARQGDFAPPAPPLPPPVDFADLVGALAERRNDLEPPALRLRPVIGDVLAALRAVPGCRLARMSGSGATCWGLFANEPAARAAASALPAAWWRAAAPILA